MIVRKLLVRLFAGSTSICFSALLAASCLADSPSYPERFGYGREPEANEIGQWDIDIMPDGRQLPGGKGTTDDGKRIYQQKCFSCHGPEGKDGINDQLVDRFNPNNNFANDEELTKTIGNFWPYATTLYDYINRAMPMNAPGSLSADEVYSLVAYLLYLNGIVDKDITVDAVTLPSIEMPAKELFYWSEEAKRLVNQKTR